MLYFDHNATSPLCDAAREAWLRACEDFPGNPSSPHRLGSRADRALANGRGALADFIGCDPADLVFTSGATESNNTIMRHIVSTEGDVLISSIEHPSNLQSARALAGDRIRLIPVHPDGVVDTSWLEGELVKRTPALISVMAANNETGVLQPWREIQALCKQHAVPFHCDASQWLGKESPAGLGDCEFVSGCAHKFGGPLGIGFLKVHHDIRPLLIGGPQEEFRRAGTENLPAILAMVAALKERSSGIAEQRASRISMRERFEGELLSLGAIIIGSTAPRLWNTVLAIMPDADCRQRWVVKLDKHGVAASTGSACASGKEQVSHVLTAMGIPKDEATRAIRFSSGWDTTSVQWERLAEKVRDAAAELLRVDSSGAR
jgi:cysteine desulfurase